MRIAIVGFGLIGGSIARALAQASRGPRAAAERADADLADPDRATGDRTDAGPAEWTIRAWSPSRRGPLEALAEGVIDAAPPTLDATIEGADVVVLAAPPLACLELLDDLAGPSRGALPPATTVTDVASTKNAIVERADALHLRFVGGHPMAGRETTGYQSASSGLFVDRPWVVVPGALAEPGDAARIADLAESCGARPIRMSAGEHDAATAAISHLPLVVATALVEAIIGSPGEPDRLEWREARRLAASGWRDMTRLARGDVDMAAGIATTNAQAIAARLHELRRLLDEWLTELERDGGPDPERLAMRFAEARNRLEAKAAEVGPAS